MVKLTEGKTMFLGAALCAIEVVVVKQGEAEWASFATVEQKSTRRLRAELVQDLYETADEAWAALKRKGW